MPMDPAATKSAATKSTTIESATVARALQTGHRTVATGNSPRKNRLLASLVYPKHCPLCRSEFENESTLNNLCTGCRISIVQNQAGYCTSCGRSGMHASGTGCVACAREKNRFDGVICLGPHRGFLREAIVRMKHAGQQSLTDALGSLIAEQMAKQLAGQIPEFLLPLPMHWKRRLLRGDGASMILAKATCRASGIPLNRHALFCTRRTKKQSTLSVTGRQKNVKGAYDVRDARSVKGKRVAIVDDTMTSGASVNEAATVLKRAGAKSVFAIVAARAV